MKATISPFGTWESPLTAEALTQGARSFSDLQSDGDRLFWLEARPEEGGRAAVMQYAGGVVEEISPTGFYARTRVHEYGGGALGAGSGIVVASSWEDQRLYRIEGGKATPLTPEPREPLGRRYADMQITFDARWVFAVCETHGADRPRPNRNLYGEEEAVNELVAIDLGSGAAHVVATGRDFYGCVRISPDGSRIVWTEWDHPAMPWDAAELWTGDVANGAVENVRKIQGGDGVSVVDAGWLADGELVYLADPDGWWRPYAEDGRALGSPGVEYGQPPWAFGWRSLVAIGPEEALTISQRRGFTFIESLGGEPLHIDAISFVRTLAPYGDQVACIAGGPELASSVCLIDPRTGALTVLRDAGSTVPEGLAVRPEFIEYPTAGGATAYGYFYRPRNEAFEGPPGELPPLLVFVHGGPTGKAIPEMNPRLLYWTSRGFAVVDVDYRGSTGYGRPYRDSLQEQWGVADVEDCVAAAEFVATQGWVDGSRMAIRGGSAGGYATLMALCTSGVFATGASTCGVADAEALALHTHKFESRYLEGLIGPYPETVDRYRERSPIHRTEGLRTPAIILQGADDPIVPRDQAEAIVAALAEKRLPHAYLCFEREQHGFREAANIIRATEAELAFYGFVFGFEPADKIEPIPLVTYE